MVKKYALLTGASGGIGNAIARQLIKDDYAVYLHYYKNGEGLKQLQEEYKNHEIFLIKADLSISDGVNELLNQVHHPIDSLILNSGNSYVGLVTDMAIEEVTTMIQLHMTSPFLITQAILPKMISNKSGNIVFITSIWGEIGASCEALYSMVKGGQNTLVKALAKELAPSNIRVNAVAPGAINTSMLHVLDESDLGALIEEIPMGRLGKPEEIAHSVQFLLSKQASYINGQIISVNGAWHT
ncbi:3-oxoacyl-[acyl-carrier protein] reductase [Bacillus mesophilus]|uniref:SDR family oxidoreductase n=1 Tax=Bacillus mesophilus TaxID=1808955 RepID=A0A6M0Q1N3_9BACI|nr:SDR family oxidoreductase [Bacillus mesophilus]MBM7659293.1 3-oxoacyl-[acyl-carrier protein] reductase [Bacillus mesophilus]NEY70167.1 SDR family oxidoreductase [Bacillus mesophilus]